MRRLAWLAGLLALLGACAAPPPIAPRPTPTAAAPIELVTLFPRDAIEALVAPPTLSAAAAAERLLPDDEVIGVAQNGEARAYPLALLHRREVVNDTVGGAPLAITFCPLCYSGIVYERTVGDRTLTFGVSGKVANNTLVMYDHETESLWGQVLGRAIEGPLAGEKLRFTTATQTTWREWREQHPDTTVADDGGPPRQPAASLGADPLGGLLARQRQQRGIQDYVIGVALGAESAAYDLTTLRERRVVNDQIGPQPIAIFFDPTTGAATVWERPPHAGAPLDFEATADPLTVTDRQTGSRWSAETGEALSGPLAGQRLVPIASRYSFWPGWVDWYPQTRLFSATESRRLP